MTRKLLLLGLGLALVFAVPAFADHGHGKGRDDDGKGRHRGVTLLKSQFAPTVPTDPFDFSPQGNAEIETTIALPSKCLAAVVLLRVNTASGPYIAASGFGG